MSPICRDCDAACRPIDGEFRIAKNTLTRIAAANAGIDGLEPVLEGPLAIGVANGDIVGFAKAINDFVRTSQSTDGQRWCARQALHITAAR